MDNPYQSPNTGNPAANPFLRAAIAAGVLLATLVLSVLLGIGLYQFLVPPAVREKGGNPALVLFCIGVLPIGSLLVARRLINGAFARMDYARMVEDQNCRSE